jgi:hypothetical protein
MKIKIENFGELTLTQKDFLASGGEGQVFAKGNVVYKIFDDLSKVTPAQKLKELSVLNHPNIISPKQMIFDLKNQPLGYTMALVKGEPICKLFTKVFKNRNNLDIKNILNLIQHFRNLIDYIHSKNILVVDLNELNFLVNNKFDNIYCIDVNSYQTKNYPATVIMDNIRDRHAKHFTPETDWFSWGILTFQMLINIHPYRGTYDPYKALPIDQKLDQRMLNNISVFNSGVTLPQVCESLDSIPSALKSWYKAVFEEGKRILPPKDFDTTIQLISVKIRQIAGTNLFKIEKIETVDEEIKDLIYHNSNRLIATNNHVYFNKLKYKNLNKPNSLYVFDDEDIFCAYLENEELKLFSIKEQKQILNVKADAIFKVENRILYKLNNLVNEVYFQKIVNQKHVLTKHVGNILDLSSYVANGCVIQNVLGKYFAVLFPEKGKCYHVDISEKLDSKYKVIDAKYENKVLVLIASKKGKYDRFTFLLNENYNLISSRVKNDIDLAEINFTVNNSGIVVNLINDGEIELFSNKSNQVKEIKDKIIESDMKFSHDDNRILFYEDKSIYSISMTKS